MSTQEIIHILIDIFAVILVIAIAVGVIFLVRKPLKGFLAQMIGDEKLAHMALVFVLILLGLEGLRVVVNFIIQPELRDLLGGISSIASGLAGVIQWIVYIGVLFFIAYSIQQKSKSK